MMSNLPKDPIILLSYINTQLRDNYDSLDELCASLDVDKNEITTLLATVGYVYNSDLNKFI